MLQTATLPSIRLPALLDGYFVIQIPKCSQATLKRKTVTHFGGLGAGFKNLSTVTKSEGFHFLFRTFNRHVTALECISKSRQIQFSSSFFYLIKYF